MTAKPPGFFEGTEMPDTVWWEALWPDPAGVLDSVGLKPGMDAIDLCAGDGWFTTHMAKLAHHVTAIDIDPAMLDLAKRRLEKRGTTTCAYVVGDAYDLAKVAEPADFVFMANAFHGVTDPMRLARAVRDTLKPGGSFAIVNWHKRPREETTILGEPRGPRTELRMSPEATIKAAEGSGLTFSHVVEVPPYHYAVVLNR